MVNSLNILSLYSGTGQHDEAVCLALEVLGYVPRVVGYCEREAFAASMLLAGMANSRIPQAPVWCDEIEKLDARPLRGWVDVIVASPPCQPYSCAGKRAGVDDHRSYGDGDGPLPHTIRIIAECRPAVVWFENVPQWVSGGHFSRFGEGLSELGYTIEDPIFLAAEDVGAPHGRERVFILGHAQHLRSGAGDGQDLPGLRRDRLTFADQSEGNPLGNGRGSDQPGRGSDRGVVVGRGGPERALGPCGGQRIDGQSSGADGLPGCRGEELSGELANNNGACAPRLGELDRSSPPREGLRDRSTYGYRELPLFPPPRGIDLAKVAKAIAKAKSPDEAVRIASAACGLASRIWRDWRSIASLEPSLMPSVESGVSVVVDGLATTPEILRAGGNGVVPLQVAVAFVYQWLSVFGTAFNHLAGDLDQAA